MTSNQWFTLVLVVLAIATFLGFIMSAMSDDSSGVVEAAIVPAVDGEATSMAVLGEVRKLGCYPSSFDSESRLDECANNVKKTREWARDLPQSAIQQEYFRWLDYTDREIARYRSEAAMWRRRDEIAKIIPTPRNSG